MGREREDAVVVMASQLNKALQFLSIEQEEEPCVLPDRP